MLSKIFRVRVRRFHRWAGIFIGIQLTFWIFSGTYFAWMPMKIVKDQDRKAEIPHPPLELKQMVPLSQLSLPLGFKPKLVHLEQAPVGIIYRLESIDGLAAVFDALNGQAVGQLRPEQVSGLVSRQIKSEEQPVKVELLQEAPGEYRGLLPVYQVSYDDFRQTHLYADPWTGQVTVRRNRFWRIYDFLWMLHILDFKDREEFNNVWLQMLSVGALVFVVSGYVLFFFGRPPRTR